VAWLPDGRRLVCVSEDGKATAWEAESGRFLGEISGHKAHCMMVATSTTGLVSTVGEDGQIILLGPDLQVLATANFDCSIEGCAWSPDAQRLAIARDDGLVTILDTELKTIASAEVSTSATRSVSWSADGEQLAVGSYSGGISVLDSASLNLVRRLTHRALWTRSIAYSGDLVVAGGFGSEPLVFSAVHGEVLSGGGTAVKGPNALLVTARRLLIGTDSGEVLSCSTEGGELESIALLDSPILSLAAGDGDTVFAGTYGGDVFKLTGDEKLLRIAARASADAPVPSLCVVGDSVLAGTYNGELLCFDTATMDVRDRRQAHAGSIKALASLGQGRLAAASTDHTISVGTLTERTSVLHHGNLINDVAFAGGFIASASRDRTVRVARLIDVDGSGLESIDVRVLMGADESVKCVGLVAHGEQVIVIAGSYDFRVYLWDVDFSRPASDRCSPRVLHTFAQAASAVSSGPDGSLYAAGWDGSVVHFVPSLHGNSIEIDAQTIIESCLI
jgi:toxoflavin biosynthesis protein ToxC